MSAPGPEIAFGLPRSLLRPIPELDVAADALDRMAERCCERDFDGARDIMRSLDVELGSQLRLYWHNKERPSHGKPREPRMGKRRAIAVSMSRAILQRDHWRCRYCTVRIVDPEARKSLQLLLAPLQIWGGSDKLRHPALLVLHADVDHVEPATHFATPALANDPGNLVACCWTCNFGKMNYTCSALGLDDPRRREPVMYPGWAGLRGVLSV